MNAFETLKNKVMVALDQDALQNSLFDSCNLCISRIVDSVLGANKELTDQDLVECGATTAAYAVETRVVFTRRGNTPSSIILSIDSDTAGVSHPVEVLEDAFLKPKGLTLLSLFKRMGYDDKQYTIWTSDCSASVDPVMAARLSIVLNTTAEFWLNLQHQWNLKVANEQLTTGMARKSVSGF